MSGDHEMSIGQYALILLGLLILTGMTVLLAFIPLEPFGLTVAMLVASIKGALVLMFFMHMKGGDRMNWMIIGTGMFLLAILIGLTIADAFTREWYGGI